MPNADHKHTGLKTDIGAVEDLVHRVKRGSIRIPPPQSGLRWGSEDVLKLFDSIYRGYPIGSLILQQGEATAATVTFGPIKVEAPETTSARWVIDGQQRLVSLAASCTRPCPIPDRPADPYVVYFDADGQAFVAPPDDGNVPPSWVPAPVLLDSRRLRSWIAKRAEIGKNGLADAVLEAGRRLRRYEIPMYVVDTDDESQLRDLFERIHQTGRPLEWERVQPTLLGKAISRPSTLGELTQELERLGMGTPSDDQLASCVIACFGQDPSWKPGMLPNRNSITLENALPPKAIPDALPPIRRALSFLRSSAAIPHLRLLPCFAPLVVLARFFNLHPDPNPRSVQLLARWTWRVFLEECAQPGTELIRESLTRIEGEEEETAVQSLLQLVHSAERTSYAIPDRFDPDSPGSRLALLALADMTPIDPGNEHPIDIPGAIERYGRGAFRQIWGDGASSPANRIFLPGDESAYQDLLSYLRGSPSAKVLDSHGLTEHAVDALLRGDRDAFIQHRSETIRSHVDVLSKRLAAWDQQDRPSLTFILEKVGP